MKQLIKLSRSILSSKVNKKSIVMHLMFFLNILTLTYLRLGFIFKHLYELKSYFFLLSPFPHAPDFGPIFLKLHEK